MDVWTDKVDYHARHISYADFIHFYNPAQL